MGKLHIFLQFHCKLQGIVAYIKF